MSIRFMDRSLLTKTMLRDTEVPWTIFLNCDRSEHQALAPALVLLEGIVDELERVSVEHIARDLDVACDFFDAEVIPHIRAACECRRQLPTHDCADAGPCYDCEGVGQLTSTLRALVDRSNDGGTEDTAVELRHVVRQLHVVTRLHFVDAVIAARDGSSRRARVLFVGGHTDETVP
jgi:hypothetical protein